MWRKGFIKLVMVLLIPIMMYSIDFGLVSVQKRPLFVIRTAIYKDGGTKLYQGLGYKVIDYNKLEGRKDMVFQSFFLNIGKPD